MASWSTRATSSASKGPRASECSWSSATVRGGERKIGYVSANLITKNAIDINQHKVFVPKAYGAGETFPHQILGVPEYGNANSVCSQSYLYAMFDTEQKARNFISYLRTKFLRVLVLGAKITQDAPSKVYRFVPLQDFTRSWTDEELYAKYKLTADEINFIESTIKPME